ncbi:putative Kinase [Zostera marina]|uniref:Putative Kinase n=1 Tax=Zostera marina TaxID=29655 RepID=A0A0K9NT30_ZOSMR|nr:putative Kinase [Zostera marina]
MRKMRFLLCFLSILSLFSTGVDSQMALKGCQETCGGVNISYPFGIGENCARNTSFLVNCSKDANGEKPYLRSWEIVNIELESGEITVNTEVSSTCGDEMNIIDLTDRPLSFSENNKLTATGCATNAFLPDGVGCSSLCSSLEDVTNNTCFGTGCCEISINKGLKIFNASIITYDITAENTSNCSYAFLAKENRFNFTTDFLIKREWTMLVEYLLDFAVDDCGPNANANKSATGFGNFCSCLRGFEGNPYTPDGCTDINECEDPTLNICSKDCVNTPGSFKCTDNSRNLIIIVSCLSGGIFFVLLGGIIFFFYKKSKIIQMKKLRSENFKQNYKLLEQTLIMSSHENTAENTKFFSFNELEKATGQFDRARIIGEGGHGTVYKGLLLDQRVAAIKMSKVTTQTEKEEYINEAALLSRTYHKNVVKVLGCCLESAVPTLVYEYIANGTLSEHLHSPDNPSSLGWDDRLRIASEVASAIVYLLSASSNTIFHRDLKSANILLDEKLTAKLSDFGASKSISSDQTHITATVQGTIGYLDPEYYQSGKLTEKSDVYSFGVILVELLTGKKPISKYINAEEGSVIIYFIKLLREGQVDLLFDQSIMDDSIKDDLGVVAKLAGECLRLRGEDRPTMKEVESTLEGVRRSKNKKAKGINHEEEHQRLLSDQMKMVSGNENWSTTATSDNSQPPISTSKSFLR